MVVAWRSLPVPSLAYGSRGTELRVMHCSTLPHIHIQHRVITWHGTTARDMFKRVEQQIARTVQKVNAWVVDHADMFSEDDDFERHAEA